MLANLARYSLGWCVDSAHAVDFVFFFHKCLLFIQATYLYRRFDVVVVSKSDRGTLLSEMVHLFDSVNRKHLCPITC